MVEGLVLWSKDLTVGEMEIPTIFGGKLRSSTKDGEIYINDARIIGEDIVTTHGAMHIIDRMLDPRDLPGYRDPKDPSAVRCKCVHRFCKDDKNACSISRGDELESGSTKEFEFSSSSAAGMCLHLAAAAMWFLV